jgi:hypothetical protein
MSSLACTSVIFWNTSSMVKKLLADLPLFVCPLATIFSLQSKQQRYQGSSIPVNTSDELVRISGQL